MFHLFTRRPSFAEGLALFAEEPGAVLLDVRTPVEFAQGHVPGAQNCPLDRLGELDLEQGRTAYVYCLSGARSAQACRYLKREGYGAVNLGGIADYRGALER